MLDQNDPALRCFIDQFNQKRQAAMKSGLLHDSDQFSPLGAILCSYYLPAGLSIKKRELKRRQRSVQNKSATQKSARVYFVEDRTWRIPDDSVVSRKLSGESALQPNEFVSLATAFEADDLLAECEKIYQSLFKGKEMATVNSWWLLAVVSAVRAAACSLTRGHVGLPVGLLLSEPLPPAFDDSQSKLAEAKAQKAAKHAVDNTMETWNQLSPPGPPTPLTINGRTTRSSQPRADGVHWLIIEGLDGRRLYARGLNGLHTSAACIARWEKGRLEPVASAVLNSSTGELICGTQGGGLMLLNEIHHTLQPVQRKAAAASPSDIFVTSHISTSKCGLEFSMAFEDGILKQLTENQRGRIIMLPSGQLSAAWVASQRIDALIVPFVSFTSFYPAVSLLEMLWSLPGKRAVPRVVSDFAGQPFGPDSVSLVAARNPGLHKELLRLIQDAPLYGKLQNLEQKLRDGGSP